MKVRLFTSLLLFVLIFIGCGDDTTTNPIDNLSANAGKITLSGAASGTFDAETAMLNTGDAVAITVADKNDNLSLLLSSKNVKTGTFSIPDEYTVTYMNTSDTTMAEIHAGSVKIDEISSTSVKGSITGSGYIMHLNTFTIDSTKTVNVNATFSM